MKGKLSIRKLNTLLIFLISSLTITGISFLDSKIWDIIFLIIFYIAYSLVGILIEIGILHGKENCSEAYCFITVILVILALKIYDDLMKFKAWLMSWPLIAKIVVPIVIGMLIGLVLVLIIIRKEKKEAK